MKLEIELNREELDSIESRRGPSTPEEFLQTLVRESVEGLVRQDFAAAVQRLGDAAKQLPYEQRTALVEQVGKMIGGE